MYGRRWGGRKTADLEQGRELLANAQASFEAAVAALTESLAVADAYDANEGTGDDESVRNR